mmetsp:Transcript_60348/g.177043  ORF Transcript_60348/g.177043 Transcript_60348/m.177043 type:complete len:456 (+) Transcript_60348:218-1585(+)
MSQSNGPAPTAQASSARWVILALTCAGLFGQFYAFDIPSALNEQLRLRMADKAGTTHEEYTYYFNLLYSVYSVPNIFLPLVLGIAVDRCGCRVLICVLGLCVVMGQAMVAWGVREANWNMMLAGRVVFGIGGESMQVAQNCLLFRWFKGKEVALALGLNLSVARAGSVLNDVLSPWVARTEGCEGAMWLGFALCLSACACNMWSVRIDKSEGERLGLKEDGSDEIVSLADVLKMPRLFWLLVALCVSLYCCILPFNNIASAFFISTFYSGMSLADAQMAAGSAMSLLFLCSAVGTPPFGGVVDYVGLRTRFLMISSVLACLCYSTIFIAPPMVSMLILGVVYTCFAGALWPAFALVVPQEQLGTAYGIATSLQNAGLAVVPMIVGYLQVRDGRGQFGGVVRLFLLFGILSTIISAAIFQENRASKKALDLPSSEAEVFVPEEAMPFGKVKGPIAV